MNNQTKKRLHLGLDLGIASVGWSLVDEQQNIVKSGSHLFKQLSVNNENTKYGESIRGKFRRTRRRLNRFKQRKIDFLCMIDEFCLPNQDKKAKTNKLSSLYKKEYQDIFGFNQTNTSTEFLFNNASNSNYRNIDLYKVYKKGFSEKLDPKELFLFLYWKLGTRGVFFKECSEITNRENYGYEDSVCFKYYEPILKTNFGKIRSSKNFDAKIPFNHHRKDIEVILNKQDEYYKNDFPSFTNFINDYLKIFDRHRDHGVGPWYSEKYLNSENSQNNKNYRNNEEIGNLYFKLSSQQRKWIIERNQDGNQKYDYLWEKNIGKCPISKIKNSNKIDSEIEKRCNQYFFIAEISNFLSQLANTKLNNEKLTIGQIKEIFKNIIKNSQTPTIEKIAEYLNCDVTNFTSYPKNKSCTSSNFDKLEKFLSIFDKKDGYIKNVHSFFEKELIKIINDFDELEKLRFELLKKYYIKVDNQDEKIKKSIDDKLDLNLKNRNKNFNESKLDASNKIEKLILEEKLSFIKNENVDLDKFCNFEKIKEQDMSGTRDYGYSAFYDYINYAINNLNDQKIDNFNVYYKNEIRDAKNESFKKNCEVNINKNSQKESLSNQFIPNKIFENIEFISPNVKNAIRETIRVINNKILKFCYENNGYELNSIILETTYGSENELKSSLLSKKKIKEEISRIQEFEEKKNTQAKEELEKHGLEINKLNIKKYKLWQEQNNYDAYDINSRIEISEFDDCEVDHIIPRSLSHDNAMTNLVLTRKINNQNKGQKTPIQWLRNDPDRLQKLKEQWKIWFPFNNKNKNGSKDKNNLKNQYNNEKYNNLVCEELEYSRFFRRNLSETTYTIRKIKEGLSTFLEIRNSQVENEEIKNEFIINNLRKIINCQIMTISGSESQYIRKLIDENLVKDRSVSDHHAHDASIIAIYSSLDYIRDYHSKMNNLWKIEKEWDDNKFNSWVQKLSFDRSKNLKEFINKNKNEIKEKLKSNKNFSYSCKPKKNKKTINWINKLLENGEQKKAIGLIKKIPMSQIFENQNFQTYKIINNEKHQVTKIDLTNGNDVEDNKFVRICLDLLKKIKNLKINDENTKQIITNYCNENNILTNHNIIFDLIQIVINKKDINELIKNLSPKTIKNIDLFSNYLKNIKDENIIDDYVHGIPIIDY